MTDLGFKGTVTLSCAVRSAPAAAQWYADKLACTQLFATDGWAEVQTPVPGVTIGLGEDRDPALGGHCPVFEVVDIVATRRALESRGVEFEGETETLPGLVMLARFHDLDGNALMLSQSLTN